MKQAAKAPQRVWMDGRLVPWTKANVHVMSHTLHYGSGVFEGIRCYETPAGPQVFRLDDHVRRLLASARCMLMDSPYSHERICRGIGETIRANSYRACYIRPIFYRGLGAFGVNPLANRVHLSIAVWQWGAYLGKKGLETGARLITSHWIKNSVASLPTKAKVTGSYANSVLAKAEAVLGGFDEAILLDHRGLVAEGSGENIFYVTKGVLHAVDNASALEGITLDSVIALATEAGITVAEGPATIDQLYNADEVFMTGTAAEVTPISEIDRRKIGTGRPGPVAKGLAAAFETASRGKNERHREWCTPVDSL